MAEKKNMKGADLEATLEESFIQKNLKKIGIIVAVVIACVALFLLGRTFLDKQNEKAAEALFPSEQLFQKGEYEKALNGDGQDILGFVQVAKKYGYTKSGNIAKLYAGLSFANLEKYEDAAKYLKDFSAKDDEMISPAALGALGNVYAEMGENDKAVKTLVKAAKKADNPVLSPIFLVQAGEILESQGKSDDALELYEEVKEKYISNQQYFDIDKYIERIKVAK